MGVVYNADTKSYDLEKLRRNTVIEFDFVLCCFLEFCGYNKIVCFKFYNYHILK